MNHIETDDLLRYSIDPALTADAASIVSHLGVCQLCARELEAIGAEDDALHDEETWAIADAAKAPPSGRLLEALQLHERIQRENEAAHGLLDRLLRPTLRLMDANISTKPAFVNAGVVRVLCEVARDFHEKKPISALDIATEAYRVAARLPTDGTTSQNLCMAYAQRERANALRLMGRFRDALLALDEAESLFNENPAADPFDIGIVNLSRAYVFYDSDRFVEAAACAHKARTVFADYPDSARQIGATIVHVGALLELGQAAEAAPAAEALIALARAQASLNMLARGLMLAGKAYRAMRRFDDAEQHYFEAVTLFEEMKLPTEAARARWQIATTAALRGDLPSAVTLLAASEVELATAGLTNDSAVATLRWAEVSLALGKPQGVAEKCRRIIVIFDSEGMQRRARAALAQLQEALEMNTATPTLAADVCEYIQTLHRNPERPFAPRPA
jgi:tetratricopeptide (TPR) repeat protein